MTLDLPFPEHDAALDAYLAEIDRALDALFLDEIGEALVQIRAERAAAPDDDAAAPIVA